MQAIEDIILKFLLKDVLRVYLYAKVGHFISQTLLPHPEIINN